MLSLSLIWIEPVYVGGHSSVVIDKSDNISTCITKLDFKKIGLSRYKLSYGLFF